MSLIPAFAWPNIYFLCLSLALAYWFPSFRTPTVFLSHCILHFALLQGIRAVIQKDDEALGLGWEVPSFHPNQSVVYAHGLASWPGAGHLFTHAGVYTVDAEDALVNFFAEESLLERLLSYFSHRIFPRLPVFGSLAFLGVRTVSHWSKWNVGGAQDAMLFAKAFVKMIQQSPLNYKQPFHHRYYLFGTSRGVSTIYNALTIMAQADPMLWEKQIKPRIAGAIFFGGFEQVESVIQFRYNVFFQYLARKFLSYTSYDSTWDPLNRASLFPSGIRVLFVGSKGDKTVSLASTKNLYYATSVGLEHKAKFNETGRHIPPQLLVLDQVNHNYNYATGEDRKILTETVKAFLKADTAALSDVD